MPHCTINTISVTWLQSRFFLTSNLLFLIFLIFYRLVYYFKLFILHVFPYKIVHVHTASYLPKDMLRIQTCSRAMKCMVSFLCYQTVSRPEFNTYSKIHEVNGWNRQNKSRGQTDLLYMHVGGKSNVHFLCREALIPWRSQPSLYWASILIPMT